MQDVYRHHLSIIGNMQFSVSIQTTSLKYLWLYTFIMQDSKPMQFIISLKIEAFVDQGPGTTWD
jgi:hypothetical protein